MTLPPIDRRPVYLIWGEQGRLKGATRDLASACKRAKPDDTIGVWSVGDDGKTDGYALKIPPRENDA